MILCYFDLLFTDSSSLHLFGYPLSFERVKLNIEKLFTLVIFNIHDIDFTENRAELINIDFIALLLVIEGI